MIGSGYALSHKEVKKQDGLSHTVSHSSQLTITEHVFSLSSSDRSLAVMEGRQHAKTRELNRSLLDCLSQILSNIGASLCDDVVVCLPVGGL